MGTLNIKDISRVMRDRVVQNIVPKAGLLVRANLDFIILLIIFFLKFVLFSLLSKIPQYVPAYILSILGAAVFLVFGTLLRDRPRIIFYLLADVFVSLSMLTDIIYLRYFGDVTSVSLVFQAWQVREVGGSIIALFNWPDVLFFVDLPLLIYFYPGLIKNKPHHFNSK